MRNGLWLAALLVLAQSLTIPPARAAAPDFGAFSLTWENDAFADTDRYYTNGVQINWVSPDLNQAGSAPYLPGWTRRGPAYFSALLHDEAKSAVSFSLGQHMYAPQDLTRHELITEDRPYAGYLYLTMGFHAVAGRVMDTVELGLGIVGEHSYAETSQKIAHQYVDGNEPQGWNNQLKDEPAVEIAGERKIRLFRYGMAGGLECDSLWHLGGAVGNVAVFADSGLAVRAGWNLPGSFSLGPIRPGFDNRVGFEDKSHRTAPGRTLGFHGFAGVTGWGIARNIFLDGNTFRHSHSVKKKSWVGDAFIGMGVVFHGVEITYTHVYRTREFEAQENDQVFGSLSISVSF